MKKLTTGLMALLLALVLCVSLLPVTAQAADTPSVTTWNIALKDNIVVNFKVNVPDVAGTTISATVNGSTVKTSQSVSGNEYTVSVPLAAAQLSDSIKLIYDVNGVQSESREYTVVEYASIILDGNYDVAVKQIVSQMLTYGAAAQNYFNYNTGALANAGVESSIPDLTLPTNVPAVSVSNNLEKVTYYGTSLVFRSQVYARFYFTMDDRDAEINNYTVTINGEDCTYGKFYDPSGRYNYFADSPGITPNNYDQQLNVVVTNTTDNTTLTISYSPLNYIVNKSSSSTSNLPELMKAMYGYHVESYQYMNYENAAAATFSSLLGYGSNGIQYDESSNVQLIFAGADANSAPEAQDYYPQSADCIKLVRNGETVSVADVTKATIQKRSSDAYHIYVTSLNTTLQDQDVLIVEGKFSTDRADDYYDGETLNIAKAYVYVDLSYSSSAEITSEEPVMWQTIDVGPFYTHSESQNNYKYMAADENDMPVDSTWNTSFISTGNASLTHVRDGVTLQISDGFQYDVHKISLTDEAKPAESYITMDMQIDTLSGNWENDIDVRFYPYNFEGSAHSTYTDKVTLKAGQMQTITLKAENYLVDGELTGIGIGIFGGPEWDAKLEDGVTPDRHTVTISNVKLDGAQSVNYDLSQSTIASGTTNTGFTDGNGSGTAVFGESIVISNGFCYDVHKISLAEATNTYVTMDMQIDTLGGNWENDIDIRFYAYNFEGNPYDVYTDIFTFKAGEKQTVTLDAAKYLVDGELTGIGIGIFGGPAWDAKLSDGYTPDRHTVSISNVKLEGAQYADFDLTQSAVVSGTTDTGYTAGNGNGKASIVNNISDQLDVSGLLIKKWGTKDYYIEGGVYNTTTLQNGEYFILEGQFRNDAEKTVINVVKTYIYKDSYNGEIFIDGELPQGWQVVDVGPFYTHDNSQIDYKYMAADENAAPYYTNWDYPYYFTDSTSLTYVHGGVSEKLDTSGLMIKKFGANGYYLEGGVYNTTTLQNGEYFILEGIFEHRDAEKVAINVIKTYIYKDTHSGEVTIAGELPTDIPYIEWLSVGEADAWLAGSTTEIDGVTHYDGGVYASFPTIEATHGAGAWGCTYNSTSVDNVKIVRDGVTTSISRAGASALDMYNQNYMYIKFHTRWSVEYTDANGNPSLLQAGDILIIEGLFQHYSTGEKIWIEKSYITMLEDGTTAFTTEMPVAQTVTLDPAGGTCSTTTLTTTTGGKVTLPTPTQTHYTFNGWSDGTTTYAAGTKLTVTSDMTLTALWTINQYTVTYNYNSGSGSPASATVDAGTAVTLPTPTRTNYTFSGWSDGTSTYAGGASYTVNGNVTLTAQWTIIQYTVTYNANGGSVSPASATVNAGTAVTLPTPTRTGYNFSSWSDGTSTYAAGASYTVNSNVTLTAQWTAINYTITITTSDKGGSWDGPATATYGASVSGTISYSGTKDKVFTVTNDTTGEQITTGSGESVSFTMPASNVTINISSGCLAEGTMITMGDGTQKPVEDIQVGDEILTWSFINGRYEVAPVCLAVEDGVDEYTVLTLKFADDTELRIVEIHGIFDAQLNEYVYIDFKNAEQYLGHSFVKIAPDGSVSTTELVDYTVTIEELGCYTLQTAVNVNCIADGILTQTPPLREGYFDYFEMGDFMQYDQEKMQSDIETYGLYTYEDFQDYLTYDAFIAFNGPYLKVAVGKGYFTFEYLIEQIKVFGIGIE